MKKLAGIIIILTAVFCWTSCNEQTQYSKEIKELNQLSSSVDKALTELQNLDTLATRNQIEDVEQNILTLKRIYIIDTVNVQEARLLKDYKAIKQAGKQFIPRRRQLIEELKYSKMQLQDLADDLEKNLHDVDKAKRFIEQEKLAIKNLLHNVEQFFDDVKYIKENFPNLNPEVQKLIEREQKENKATT